MTTENARRVGGQWLLLLTLAWLGQPFVAADAPKLEPGVELPLLEVKALTGDLAVLPRDVRGRAAVLVIGFSKAAAKLTAVWLDRCRSTTAAGSAGSGVSWFDVRMLEGVPRFLRGSIERGMRSGFPVDRQRETLLVYRENDAWRERLRAADDKTAYVIGCDREGRVRGIASGQYVDVELRKILEEIEAMPPKSE